MKNNMIEQFKTPLAGHQWTKIKENIFLPTCTLTLFVFVILHAIGFSENPLPFVDLIAFAQLNSLSSEHLAQGRDFYSTQVSYILPHFLFRVLSIWGLNAIQSSLLVYCLMLSAYFCFIQVVLYKCKISFFSNLFLSLIVAILLQSLGLMIWGGPLFFSVGIAFSLLSYSFVFILNTGRSALIAAFFSSIFAVLCHPFMLPIIGLLYFSNIALLPRKKIFEALFIVFFSYLVVLTSKNDFFQFYKTGFELTPLAFVDLNLRNIVSKIPLCVTFQINATRFLLGEHVLFQYITSIASGLVILIGSSLSFIFVFFTIWKTKKYTSTTFKLGLSTSVFFLYYIFASESPFGISMWPQRLLICILPLATLSFYLIINELYRHFNCCRSPKPIHGRKRTINPKNTTHRYAVHLKMFSIALAAIITFFYYYSFRELASQYKSDAKNLENIVINSGLKDTYLYFDQVNIFPIWKRSVPFALFTSDSLREKNVFFVSEWHMHPQHNVRSTYKLKDLPLTVIGVSKNYDSPWTLFTLKN